MSEPGSLAPTDKITAASVGGAVSTITVWVLSTFAQVPIPTWLAAAVTVLTTAGAGYARREKNPVTEPPMEG